MALPSMATPTFKTKIPSTGKTIEYRPFLVKEEKILLMALEGGDPNEMTNATKKILQSCIIDDLDIESLATFDIEYLFLQLRGKSVGEVIDLIVGHTNKTECDHKTEVSINIDDIKVEGVKRKRTIQLTDSIGVKVRYPSMRDIDLMDDDKEGPFKVIASCIETVYDGDELFEEFTQQEMELWLESLNKQQFDKIADFFSEPPKLSYKVEWTCSQCKQKDSFLLEGLTSFFM